MRMEKTNFLNAPKVSYDPLSNSITIFSDYLPKPNSWDMISSTLKNSFQKISLWYMSGEKIKPDNNFEFWYFSYTGYKVKKPSSPASPPGGTFILRKFKFHTIWWNKKLFGVPDPFVRIIDAKQHVLGHFCHFEAWPVNFQVALQANRLSHGTEIWGFSV